LSVASIITNMLFMGSLGENPPGQQLFWLRFMYLGICGGILMVLAVCLKIWGFRSFLDKQDKSHLELKTGGVVASSTMGALLLVGIFLGNLYTREILSIPWVHNVLT